MAATSRTLAEAEKIGGHTITRHVGLTDEELIARGLPEASTFNDLATAEAATARNIAAHQAEIRTWLEGSSKRLKIVSPADGTAGRIYLSDSGEFVQPRHVLTILKRTGNGYYVRTSYLLP